MSLRHKSLASRNLTKPNIHGTNFASPHAAAESFTTKRKENGSLQNNRIKSQERRPMMDLVYVLAIVGFFGLCIAYTYAFDRI